MANQAAALARLDAGALNDIFEDTPGRVEQCVVQCVQIKPIVSQQSGATERHRVVFSDSRNYVQTMLATALNHYVHQGLLQRGVFLKLLSYQANNVKSKKVLIVTDIEIIQELGVMEKLGNPVALEIKSEDEDKSHPTAITSNAGAFYGNNQQRAMPAVKAPTSSAHANIYPIEVRTTDDMYLRQSANIPTGALSVQPQVDDQGTVHEQKRHQDVAQQEWRGQAVQCQSTG